MKSLNPLFPAIRAIPTKFGVIDRFETLEDIKVELDEGTIIVPAGTITDIASIPKIALSVLTRTGQDLVAFVVHDYLYANHWKLGLNRLDIDNIMREIMITSLFINKTSNLRIRFLMHTRVFLIYWAVRLFGYPFYARWIKLD